MSLEPQNSDEKKLEKAKFVCEQASLRLAGSSESAESLEKKAFAFLKICIPIFNVLLLAVLLPPDWMGTFLRYFVLIYAIILSVALGALAAAVTIWDYHSAGNDPESLTESNYFNQPLDAMILGEAMNYQERIDQNYKTIVMKSRAIQTALILIIFGSLVALLVAWALANPS